MSDYARSFEISPAGISWPAGDYFNLAMIATSGAAIAQRVGTGLHVGDELGLGRWQAIGLRLRDDLSTPRDIDFTVVMPGHGEAAQIQAHFLSAGFVVNVEKSCAVPELPWDVVVVKHMFPHHAEITAFEDALAAIAVPLGGRNDGWGCFGQSQISH